MSGTRRVPDALHPTYLASQTVLFIKIMMWRGARSPPHPGE
jgi:hypothetical protein